MRVALFDMDGTLTPARGKMSAEMCAALTKLQQANIQVGIVSGSGIDYIMQQCQVLGDVNQFDYTTLNIYPCNGTQHYRLDTNGRLICLDSTSFREHVGSKLYAELIFKLSEIHSSLGQYSWHLDIPLTGNFVNCRGTMVNFCPIGRNANQEERSLWVSLDRKYKIRESILQTLRAYFAQSTQKIIFKLGGETSIDIFPEGWDKSYVLKNYSEKDQVYFVGDRCGENGNDKELYDAVNLIKPGTGYETSGPKETITIIEKIIRGLK